MDLSYTAARRGSLIAVAAVAALAIAACGSSSSSSSTSSSTAATRTGFRNPAQRAKLVACLKQHGVTLPSRPGGGGAGTPGAGPPPGGAPGRRQGRGLFFGGAGANPRFRTALQACGATFGGARFGAGVSPTARRAAISRFVTCVRRHGYNLPAPNFSGNGAVFPAKIQSKPKFVAASRTCASLLRPPGGAAGAPADSSSPGA